MKAYQTHIPVLVVGGEAGSFLGEYQAGGYIIVLGLNTRDHAPVGRFPAAGMHGGKIFLRTDCDMPFDIPAQVLSHEADDAEKAEIAPLYGSSLKIRTRMPTRFLLTASLSLCRTARIRIAPCM